MLKYILLMIDNLIKLKDYVPLFQTMLWIGFIVVFFLIYKKTISDVIKTLILRIKKGSSIKAGPIEIGEELKGMQYANQTESSTEVKTGSDGQQREKHRRGIYEKNKGLFLTHLIYPLAKSRQKFDIYIYLIRHVPSSIDKEGALSDIDKADALSDIDKAEFFFGHMWGNKVFSEKTRNGIIGISTSAYAPFLCTCIVRLKDGEEIQLDRYIDFEISKIYEKIK